MKGALFLDVVVRERPTILQLLSSEDQSLLVGWDPLLVLNLRLHIINRVRGLDFQRDRLPSQRLDENLHTSSKTEHKMKCRLLLDVIIGKSAPVLKLFTSENETLLVGGNAFLVLNLGFDIVDRVRGLDLQRDGLPGQCLDEDLHTATETKN